MDGWNLLCSSPQLIAPAAKGGQLTGNAMRDPRWTRREVLKTSTAVAAGVLFAEPIRAAAPPPTSLTRALIEAARKEGKVSYYSALELNVAERLGKTFGR
jgi:iron(III) transport system substrate-binding protein